MLIFFKKIRKRRRRSPGSGVRNRLERGETGKMNEKMLVAMKSDAVRGGSSSEEETHFSWIGEIKGCSLCYLTRFECHEKQRIKRNTKGPCLVAWMNDGSIS